MLIGWHRLIACLAAAAAAVAAAGATTTRRRSLPNSFPSPSSGLVEEGKASETRGRHPLSDELVDWLRSKPGSYFHPHLEIRIPEQASSSSSDEEEGGEGGGAAEAAVDVPPHPRHGIFATRSISAGQLLIAIPPSLVLQPGRPQVGDRVKGYFSVVKAAPQQDDDDDDAADDDSDGEVREYPGVVTSVTTAENGTVLYSMLCDGEREESTGMTIDMLSHEGTPINCATVRLLAKEMRSEAEFGSRGSGSDAGSPGGGSAWGPYVRYLRSLASQRPPERPLPSSWSEAGQEYLGEVLGHFLEDYGGDALLPPKTAFGWVESDWYGRCGGEDGDPLEHEAYMLVRQRSYDDLLVPVFDILSHHNGRLLNTVSSSIRLAVSVWSAATAGNHHGTVRGGAIQVHASREIQAGEELFVSYNFCTDCADGRSSGYGTPELLRDYGFVEDYPRQFVFYDQGISFDIDYAVNQDGVPTDELFVNWTCAKCRPDEEGLKFLDTQWQRLRDLADTDFDASSRPRNVPGHEWRVAREYLEALMVAMEHAANQFRAEKTDLAPTRCTDELCSVASDRYPKLEDTPEDWAESRPSTCSAWTEFSYDEWVNVMTATTVTASTAAIGAQRKIAVDFNPTMSNDVCFSVDSAVQICSSYRPHYSEMMVHYAARFVPKIRRVLIVGSGSRSPMLLHEALKYPTLERVTLLDLDPTSVRESYRYFGVQPHFDDPRVDWWFGDVPKSLRVLSSSPNVVGSFDLVLLDLSEEDFQSACVSPGDEQANPIAFLEELSLLMAPTDSVLVQNQMLHFGPQAKVFRDAMHVHLYGVPVVCSLSFSLASNGIDFMRGPSYSHAVLNLLEGLESADNRYTVIRDYQRNDTNPSFCEKRLQGGMTNQPGLGLAPGALLLAEAEVSATALSSPSAGMDLIVRTLKSEGLSILTKIFSPKEGGFYSVVVICQEGYVLSSIWPSRISFDLYFWADHERQDSVRRALHAAVSSSSAAPGSSSSAYRVVVGGLTGVASGDPIKLSVRKQSLLKELCGVTESKERIRRKLPEAPRVDSLLLNAVVDSLRLINEPDVVVAVICGQKDQDCKSVENLRRSNLVQRVVPLHACRSIDGGVEYSQDGPERLFSCEKETLGLLKTRIDASKIRAIVLDDSTVYPMAQVILRIFANHLHQQRFLADDMFVVAAVSSKEPWRKVLVDTFREDIFDDDPSFGTILRFNITKAPSSFEIALMSSGNKLFPKHLAEYVDREWVQEGLTIVKEIVRLRSGSFLWVEEFEASATFSHADYDNSGSRSRWSAQEPLGIQTVFQLEIDPFGMSNIQLERYLQTALRRTGLHPSRYQTQVVGVGYVIFALWSTGSLAVVWNGHTHIDVILFTTDMEDDLSDDQGESYSSSWVDRFNGYFVDNIGSLLSDPLRDVFPRGSHRVILQPKPDEDEIPVWA